MYYNDYNQYVIYISIAPNEKMKEVLQRTISEAKSAVSKVLCDGSCTYRIIYNTCTCNNVVYVKRKHL